MDNNLNYGVVGNCRTAALVSARGTIEWMCLPDFDSPSVFASLLDRRKGGCFGFDVAEEYRISQAYIPHTNILATTFSAAEGEFVILDFMPCYRSRRDEHYMPPELYRYVRWVRGRPRLRVHYAPAPDYARGRTEQTVTPEFIESHSLSDPKNRLYLYASLPLGKIARREEIVLERDEFFLLSHNEKVIPVDIEREKLEYCRTLVYWLNWTNRTKRFTYYNDVIERSLLTLKLMSYYNGAVLAALTTSLPESAGDVRNWDYRFCWLRDASMSIETTLDHLSGYKNSKPVRIGNDAYHQRQNDSFGYLMDLIYQYYRLMPGSLDEIEDMWEMVKNILSTVTEEWRKPDKGIWEIRGRSRQFVSSKVMCWVALDRGAKVAAGGGRPTTSATT